jgi:hypothetical protein
MSLTGCLVTDVGVASAHPIKYYIKILNIIYLRNTILIRWSGSVEFEF